MILTKLTLIYSFTTFRSSTKAFFDSNNILDYWFMLRKGKSVFTRKSRELIGKQFIVLALYDIFTLLKVC